MSCLLPRVNSGAPIGKNRRMSYALTSLVCATGLEFGKFARRSIVKTEIVVRWGPRARVWRKFDPPGTARRGGYPYLSYPEITEISEFRHDELACSLGEEHCPHFAEQMCFLEPRMWFRLSGSWQKTRGFNSKAVLKMPTWWAATSASNCTSGEGCGLKVPRCDSTGHEND